MHEMIARVGDRVNKDGIASVCLTGEEIVRCKYCKWWDVEAQDKAPKWLPCMAVNKGGEWFCADGERKES